MTDTAEVAPLRRRQKVRAAFDLPGVPAGTPGKVALVNGFGPWIRYRVIFDNGVDRGNVLREELEPR
ncbi:MAG: hypothetical protein U5K29_09475 [Acidimicrobiales bacterium]|nr:hypothetical protein [Acidimicrobiales bacterium]